MMEGDAKNLAKTEKRNSFQRMQSKCENYSFMNKPWEDCGCYSFDMYLGRDFSKQL